MVRCFADRLIRIYWKHTWPINWLASAIRLPNSNTFNEFDITSKSSTLHRSQLFTFLLGTGSISHDFQSKFQANEENFNVMELENPKILVVTKVPNHPG